MTSKTRALASSIFATACFVAGCADNDTVAPGTGVGSGSGSGAGGGSGSGSGSGMGSGSGSGSAAVSYAVVGLASDKPIAGIPHTDPDLVNAWGLVPFEDSFWIANNGTGLVAIYDGTGAPVKKSGGLDLRSDIDGIAINPSHNPTDLMMQNGTPCTTARLLFASEDGVIIGVNPDLSPAVIQTVVDRTAIGAVFKGVAIATEPDGSLLVLAADFHNGTVDLFDTSFQPVTKLGTSAFVDPKIPSTMAPFNVAVIDDAVFVTYATQDAARHDDVPGAGAIAKFDLSGKLLADLVGGPFSSPWGMTIAPASFCAASGKTTSSELIVGNFGDGTVNMVDPVALTSIGKLDDKAGNPIAIDGLWGLSVAEGVTNAMAGSLYFTAGPNAEADGLFGRIDPVQ
ncbi:MAG TPA: TIGR03118 family protein [Kofleriaceae bacterium]|nr:TIGR03118 family protein [Kofleriaceae bacterium]